MKFLSPKKRYFTRIHAFVFRRNRHVVAGMHRRGTVPRPPALAWDLRVQSDGQNRRIVGRSAQRHASQGQVDREVLRR